MVFKKANTTTKTDPVTDKRFQLPEKLTKLLEEQEKIVEDIDEDENDEFEDGYELDEDNIDEDMMDEDMMDEDIQGESEEENELSEEDNELISNSNSKDATKKAGVTETDEDDEEEDEDADALALSSSPVESTISAPSTKEKAKILKQYEKFGEKEKQKGIVYITHLFKMAEPLILRQHLSKFGELGRIYMTPKKISKANRNKNKRPVFENAWVEFVDKRKAKKAALMLNGTAIGGRRRSRIHHHTWCIKYLSGIRWSDVTERQTKEKYLTDSLLREALNVAKEEAQYYADSIKKEKEISMSMRKSVLKRGLDVSMAGEERARKQRKIIKHSQRYIKNTNDDILDN